MYTDIKINSLIHHLFLDIRIRMKTIAMSANYEYWWSERCATQDITGVFSSMGMNRAHPKVHILES